MSGGTQLGSNSNSGSYSSLRSGGNSSSWKTISGHHSIPADLSAVNPNFSSGREWQDNCQRCVPTYEMRRRGFDVTAQSTAGHTRDLHYYPFDVWQNADVLPCRGSGLEDIKTMMAGWGEGARAQVTVCWKNTNLGHTFIAEQVGGKTIFVDPQSNKINIESDFSHVKHGQTRVCRIDTLQPSTRIHECCKGI